MAKKFEIRNSTVEFLTFVAEGKEQGIQVLYKDETVWATQKAMAVLFDCSADNIGLHLKNIYDTNELNKEATTEKISVVQQEGVREVRRNTLFYNLDAIISVGYRVNSTRVTFLSSMPLMLMSTLNSLGFWVFVFRASAILIFSSLK